MSAAYGIIPVLGGTALLVGGTSIMVVDRWDLRGDPLAPRPILLRYTSQATFALNKRPHWIFVIVSCVFGPCLIMTSIWQAALAEELEESEQATTENLPFLLILQAVLCAVGGYGVALLPMGNSLGTGVHVMTATLFAVFGIQYCFRSYQLAEDRGNDALANLRLSLGLFGGFGGLTTCASVVPGVAGTAVLAKHRIVCETNPNATTETEGFLSVRGRWWARLGETVLALGQISIAIAMGLCCLSAVSEVGDVSSDEPATALWVGVCSGLLMAVGAILFYRTNDFWYATCQMIPDVEGDAEEEHDPDAGNKTKEGSNEEGMELSPTVHDN